MFNLKKVGYNPRNNISYGNMFLIGDGHLGYRGTLEEFSKEEYFERVIAFIEHISPDIVIERLFSRVPEEDAYFSNWNTSWWKLQDELLDKMMELDVYQGKRFDYLNGSALNKL